MILWIVIQFDCYCRPCYCRSEFWVTAFCFVCSCFFSFRCMRLFVCPIALVQFFLLLAPVTFYDFAGSSSWQSFIVLIIPLSDGDCWAKSSYYLVLFHWLKTHHTKFQLNRSRNGWVIKNSKNLWWWVGGWWWIPSKNLVTSDRLVVRESVGLGQRGSDNYYF